MSQMLTRLILSLYLHIGMYMCVNVYMIYLCVYRESCIKIETAEMKEGRKERREALSFPDVPTKALISVIFHREEKEQSEEFVPALLCSMSCKTIV